MPEHLSRYPVAEIPVDQLGLFALDPGQERQAMRYSVFDRQRHHVHRLAAQSWSISDLVSEAIRSCSEGTKAAQVLELHLPGVATPQIVLTPATATQQQLCVPIDMRPFGGRPCTLLLTAGAPSQDVIQQALQTCPAGPVFLPPAQDGRDLFLVDARGQVWYELPADLSQLQWLRISGQQPLDALVTEQDFFAPSAHAVRTAASSTTTSTWVGHSVVEHVSFVMAGLGITIRLHPQHVSQVSVPDSIADLVMALARQRALPPRTRIVLTAAQPHPLTRKHVTILFLLFPEDHRRHVILDPSADGSMAQSISIDPNSRPEELVAAAQAREGYIATVNGCPRAASRRVLYNGDYTQVVQRPRDHRVAPTDWFYELYPDLRLFAFPVEIPRLQRATATPLDPTVQTLVRDAFLRYLRQRMTDRRQVMGQPAADTQAVVVQGAAHAPALLFVPGRICPVLQEVEEALTATGLFEEGTTFADSCELTHQHAPLFLSIPRGMVNMGIFFPTPTFWMGYHLIWLPPDAGLSALTLPTRRGFVLEQPAALRHGAAVTHRSAAAPPRRPASGTSFAQVHTDRLRQQARCERSRLEQEDPRCKCIQGVLSCPRHREELSAATMRLHAQLDDAVTALCPEAETAVQAEARAKQPKWHEAPNARHLSSVPTPLGRRHVPLQPEANPALQSEAQRSSVKGTESRQQTSRGTPALALADLIPQQPTGLSLGTNQLKSPHCPNSSATAANPECCLRFAVNQDVQEHVLQPFRVANLEKCGSGITLHPQAKQLFDSLEPLPHHESGDHAMLFVDGSFDPKLSRGAWAVAVAVESQGAWYWGGFASGLTASEPEHPNSAYQAEVYAQLVAHLIVAAMPWRNSAVIFDATAAAQAHIASVVQEGVLDWLWLPHASQHGPHWPVLDENGGTDPARPGTTMAPAEKPKDWAMPTRTKHCRSKPLRLLLGTYNTLSAKTCLQRHSLQAFVKGQQIDVLALQEARETPEPVRIIEGVHRFASQAVQGQLGCQIWVNVAKQPGAWDVKSFAILHSHPRLLVVKAKVHGQPLLLVSGHARTSASTEADIQERWTALDQVLRQAPRGCVPIVGVDANAHWNGGAPDNANACHMEVVSKQHSLCSSGTCTPDGTPIVTWTSPQGKTFCLDFILYPDMWHAAATVLGARPILDLHSGVDHDPLLLRLDLCLAGHAQETSFKLDTESTHTPEGKEIIVKAASRCDEACFTKRIFAEAAAEGPARKAQLIRAVLKTGRRYKSARTAIVLREGGQDLVDQAEVLQRLGAHFAAAEQATPLPLCALSTSTGPPERQQFLEAQELPTIADLARGFAGLKPRKAAGISGISADFYKASPARAAQHHFPVVLKMAARGQAPLLWTGSLSVPIAKPAKDRFSVTGYRAIALLEASAKAVGRALRPRLLQGLERVVHPGTAGARRGFPLELPAVTSQLFLDFLKNTRTNGALLFVDGVSAFYATSRVALGTGTAAERSAWIAGLPIEPAIKEIYLSIVQGRSCLEHAQIEEMTQRMITAGFRSTWFSTLPETPLVFCTQAGTIPGAPLADLLFQLTIAPAFESLQRSLHKEGLAAHVGEAEPHLLTWLDDFAVPVTAENSADLANRAARTASLTAQALALAGIEMNFGAGKSEAILQLHGPGAQAAKAEVFISRQGQIPVHLPAGRAESLVCTEKYVHLGSLRGPACSAVPDIQRRKITAASVCGHVCKRLLRNKELTLDER
ncbi:unnamed protein product, partial [Symbiodinium sp. CCMP2456]